MKPVLSIRAFTLIELSIVLVIIGLVVGGVLVGRDLISAAAVRAQLSQIEKYQTAVNTFKVKYNYLPGDIPEPYATRAGLAVRGDGSNPGQGDGNGIVESLEPYAFSMIIVGYQGSGEAALFWNDLSTARMVEGRFIGNCCIETSSTAFNAGNYSAWIPPAALANSNYVFVVADDAANFFFLSRLASFGGWQLEGVPGLTVQQASSIDTKIDDAIPQQGRVTARTTIWNSTLWVGAFTTGATAGSATTCYDNNNVAGAVHKYSLTQNGGRGVNCSLSFKFQ